MSLRVTDVPVAPQQVHEIPKDWRPSAQWNGVTGEITSEPLEGAPNFEELLTEHGHNPDEVEVVGSVRTSRWQMARRGEEPTWLTSYRFTIQRKKTAIDLPALFAEVRKTKVKPAPVLKGEALIVVWADPQTGKTDPGAEHSSSSSAWKKNFMLWNVTSKPKNHRAWYSSTLATALKVLKTLNRKCSPTTSRYPSNSTSKQPSNGSSSDYSANTPKTSPRQQ